MTLLNALTASLGSPICQFGEFTFSKETCSRLAISGKIAKLWNNVNRLELINNLLLSLDNFVLT